MFCTVPTLIADICNGLNWIKNNVLAVAKPIGKILNRHCIYLAELKQTFKEKSFWIINVCQKCFEIEFEAIAIDDFSYEWHNCDQVKQFVWTRFLLLVSFPFVYDLRYSLLATLLLANPYVILVWYMKMDWIQIEPTYRFCKDSEIAAHTHTCLMPGIVHHVSIFIIFIRMLLKLIVFYDL